MKLGPGHSELSTTLHGVQLVSCKGSRERAGLQNLPPIRIRSFFWNFERDNSKSIC